MSQTIEADFTLRGEKATRSRSAEVLGRCIFGLLLLLIVVTAVPYGTNEPWLKAAFICGVFAICIVALIQSLVSGELRIGGATGVLVSMLALCAFAFLQTISFRSGTLEPAISVLRPWTAISADPYQTRFFVLQLLALTTALALFYRYANTKSRIRTLVHVVIGVAVASAVFGIVRQIAQDEPGFLLPLIKPNQGYAQFINKNHFALLMEMALGLGIGMGLGNGLNRERSMAYAAMLIPVWTALVLSNSRGGILAMLAQAVVSAILPTSGAGMRSAPDSRIARLGRSSVGRGFMLFCLVVVILFGTVWVGGDRLVNTLGAVSTELNPEATGDRSGVTRNEIWRASWKTFTAHPMLGVGLGGYWIAITAYHDAAGTMTPQEAHNDYLELLASGGIIGFAIGICFVVAVVRRARQNLASENTFQRAVCFAAILGITGIAVHSLVDFGLHMLVNALVFVVLVMLATKKIDDEQNTLES